MIAWDLYPQLSEHTVAPPALLPFPEIERVERTLSAWCARGDAPPRAFAALGNVLVREGRYVDALAAYHTAADADPSDAGVQWMCAEIAHVLDDAATSRTYRARALALQRLFPDPLPAGARTPVLLLLRDLPYSANTPLELILDRGRIAVHKLYLEGDIPIELPPHAVAFCAFGAASDAAPAVEAAARDFPSAINDPRGLAALARAALPATLRDIPGVRVPQAAVVDAAALGEITLPALVRPIDTHAGEGFAYVTDRAWLAEHAARYPAPAYDVSAFVDYRSADGLYRKFRAIFVDGEPFAYHLALSPSWMVHYQSAPMRELAAARDEERRFLEDPAAFVPGWEEKMRAIAGAIGLDYFGIDAAVLPGGDLLVFEADAAMLVHDEDARDVFAYKRPYVARIREALHALIARRTPRRTP
jgi:tetratricopeptide (TPR) repeat protein